MSVFLQILYRFANINSIPESDSSTSSVITNIGLNPIKIQGTYLPIEI